MGIAASQPIRGMDINAPDVAARNRVAQSLQGRTRRGRTAVALIDALSSGLS